MDIDYDPEHDRLFSLGDLIDYGTRSADAIEWMQNRFAGTVRGNHEHMMRDWLVLGSRMWNEGRSWRQHWASAWCPGVAERLAIIERFPPPWPFSCSSWTPATRSSPSKKFRAGRSTGPWCTNAKSCAGPCTTMRAPSCSATTTPRGS